MAKFKILGASVRVDAAQFNNRFIELASLVAEQASVLAAMVEIYASLERLITRELDSPEATSICKSAGALMKSINEELKREVDKLVQDTTELYAFAAEEVGGK